MNGLKKVLFLREFGGLGLEESSLSSKVQGNGGWKKVRFLRKFWGMGVGRKFAFFESIKYGDSASLRIVLHFALKTDNGRHVFLIQALDFEFLHVQGCRSAS